LTVADFCSFFTATRAIDHIVCDTGNGMDDFPAFGGLDAKRIIVCNRGDSGVAGAAVKAAGGNDSFVVH